MRLKLLYLYWRRQDLFRRLTRFPVIFICSQRSYIDTKGWDVFRTLPPEAATRSEATNSKLYFFSIKLLKVNFDSLRKNSYSLRGGFISKRLSESPLTLSSLKLSDRGDPTELRVRPLRHRGRQGGHVPHDVADPAAQDDGILQRRDRSQPHLHRRDCGRRAGMMVTLTQMDFGV